MKDYWPSLAGVLIGIAGIWLLLSIVPTSQEEKGSFPVGGEYYVRMLKVDSCLPGKTDIGMQKFTTLKIKRLAAETNYYKIVDFGNMQPIEAQFKNGHFGHQYVNTWYTIKVNGRAFDGKINFIMRMERHVNNVLLCTNTWHVKGNQVIPYYIVESFSKNITSDMGYYDGLGMSERD